jgi:hypothetical protein
VIQAVALRSEKSLERWGENLDVIWANDGRGLIVLVRLVSQGINKLIGRLPHPTYYSTNSSQRLLSHTIIHQQQLSPRAEEQAKEIDS